MKSQNNNLLDKDQVINDFIEQTTVLDASPDSKKIGKNDVTKAWARYLLSAEVASGFERLTALAFCFGIVEVLQKLYGDNKQRLKEAIQRHLMFYNTEAIWGSLIMGISVALESEHKALIDSGADEDQIKASSDMINSVKIGLMGPLAGIGDTVNHGMIRPLLLSAFIPLAAEGSWVAGAAPFLIWVIGIGLFAYTLAQNGYRLGRKSVTALLQSGRINQFIEAASVLGLFMMGALSSTYIKLQTAIEWTNAVGEVVTLQSYLDNLFPKLLPLLVVFGIYGFFKKKGPKYIPMLIIIIVASLVLSFFGIV